MNNIEHPGKWMGSLRKAIRERTLIRYVSGRKTCDTKVVYCMLRQAEFKQHKPPSLLEVPVREALEHFILR